MQKFNGIAAKHITHVIYLTLNLSIHTESLAFLDITKLGNLPMILSQIWMKNHRVIVDRTNNFLVFWLGHYIYIRARTSITLSKPRLQTKIIGIKLEKVLPPQKMIKRE